MPKTLSLTLQDTEPIPTAGETRLFYGLAGLYAVTIHRVQRVEHLADHQKRVTVRATRRLVQSADFAVPGTETEERLSQEPRSCFATERSETNGC